MTIMAGGRPLASETTVLQQKRYNIQINEQTRKEEYIAFSEKKDATLEAPNLIPPSLQTNIRAGELPEPEAAGTRYLRLPLNVLGGRK